MSFVALHRGRCTSLATDRPWLAADELTQVERARELLVRLEQLVASREAELAAARAAAQAEGFEQGRREARAAEAPRLWDAWDQAARSAAAEAGQLRGALVALALQVVERIAQDLGPAETVAALARRAADALLPDSAAVLRVHPALAADVKAQLGSAPGVLDVRADATLGPWDLAFETPAGRVLAGLPLQLQRVAQALEDAP